MCSTKAVIFRLKEENTSNSGQLTRNGSEVNLLYKLNTLLAECHPKMQFHKVFMCLWHGMDAMDINKGLNEHIATRHSTILQIFSFLSPPKERKTWSEIERANSIFSRSTTSGIILCSREDMPWCTKKRGIHEWYSRGNTPMMMHNICWWFPTSTV